MRALLARDVSDGIWFQCLCLLLALPARDVSVRIWTNCIKDVLALLARDVPVGIWPSDLPVLRLRIVSDGIW